MAGQQERGGTLPLLPKMSSEGGQGMNRYLIIIGSRMSCENQLNNLPTWYKVISMCAGKSADEIRILVVKEGKEDERNM